MANWSDVRWWGWKWRGCLANRWFKLFLVICWERSRRFVWWLCSPYVLLVKWSELSIHYLHLLILHPPHLPILPTPSHPLLRWYFPPICWTAQHQLTQSDCTSQLSNTSARWSLASDSTPNWARQQQNQPAPIPDLEPGSDWGQSLRTIILDLTNIFPLEGWVWRFAFIVVFVVVFIFLIVVCSSSTWLLILYR